MRLLPDRRVSDKRSAEPEVIHFYGDEIQRTYTGEPVIALVRLGISDLPLVQAKKIILALLVEIETVAAHIVERWVMRLSRSKESVATRTPTLTNTIMSRESAAAIQIFR